MNRKYFLTAALGAAVAGWLLWGNTAIVVTEYPISSKHLPKGFDGFRIAHISDLHNAEFGAGNRKLLSVLAEAKPDIIVLTGDLIDSRKTDMAVSCAFAEEAMKVAPCYYVTGNHEARIRALPDFLDQLEAVGVRILRNESLSLEHQGDRITLMGVDDPLMVTEQIGSNDKAVLTAALGELTRESREYTILLSHRPEWFSLYREHGINLVFSGHAHGGQVRLPMLGGVIAPNQWFFPEYDAGIFSQDDTTMVVSRGLGASIFPLRVNNRPEVVVTELVRQET